MSFDYGTLVTDRTASDAAARNSRGTYSAADLNRVTAAMEDLDARLTGHGYATGFRRLYLRHQDGTLDTRWREDDEPAWTQLETYRANAAALRGTLAVLESTPEAPETMAFLDWARANDIERILADLDGLIRNMEQAWFYSGDLYAGEV